MAKNTGIVRKLDELGRITLPIELRRTLGVANRDPLEISVDGEKVILQKYIAPTINNGKVCSECSATLNDTRLVQGNKVTLCGSCAAKFLSEV